MTDQEKQFIQANLHIDAKVLRLVHNERAVVLVSWTNFGLVDAGSFSRHELEVFEDSFLLYPTPALYEGDEAYKAGYSCVIDSWNPTKEHIITLLINTEIAITKTIPPFVGAVPQPIEEPFDRGNIIVTVKNTERGIKLKVDSPCSTCIEKIWNVTIQKQPPAGILEDTFTSSIPFPYTIDTEIINYPFIVKDYDRDYQFVQQDFDDIYLERSKMLVYLKVIGDPYVLVDDLVIINSYREAEIVRVASITGLNTLKYNDKEVIYYDLSTESYYKYRDTSYNVPIQGVQDIPEMTSRWYNLNGLLSPLGELDIYIDGTQVEETDKVQISTAIMDVRNNFTSYNAAGTIEIDSLHDLLPPGVQFMDDSFSHVDTDVIHGEEYRYKIDIQTLDGTTYTVFNSIIQRLEPTKGNLSVNVFEEALRTPLNPDTTLNENDFISGPANGHLSLSLSDSDEDYNAYLASKDRESNLKCQS